MVCLLVAGKTSFFIRQAKGIYQEEWIPTVFDQHCVYTVLDGETHVVALWDTAAQASYTLVTDGGDCSP